VALAGKPEMVVKRMRARMVLLPIPMPAVPDLLVPKGPPQLPRKRQPKRISRYPTKGEILNFGDPLIPLDQFAHSSHRIHAVFSTLWLGLVYATILER